MSLAGLRLRGEADVPAPWRAAIESALAAGDSRHEVLPGSPPGFFKGSGLRGRPALRHAARSWAGIADVPRLQEFDNLTWLRAHGFAAPRPILAGVRLARGLPRYQFLITEHLPDCPNLQVWLREERSDRRAALLESLATDVARLHALGFVHRDLFLRNVLVAPTAARPRPIFLDAWRGGPRPGWRGPLHDLACLFLDAAGALSPLEQTRLLARYAEVRRRSGRPLRGGWPRRLAARRAALFAREARRRSDPLEPEWDPPMEEGPSAKSRPGRFPPHRGPSNLDRE